MIEGKWYAEGSAASYVARLIIINDTEYRVTVANGDTYQGTYLIVIDGTYCHR